MNNLSQKPLHLFQVLEEEFLSLHGDSALQPTVVTLKHRPVAAGLDWDFGDGHIKSPDRLANLLHGDGAKGVAEVCERLRRLLPDMDERLARYERSGEAGERDASVLEDLLNELLKKEVYEPESFKHVTFKNSTREALRVRAGRHRRQTSNELAHINRLLLEETFPDELESISDIRLAAMYKRLHTRGHAALSLSGGGIRSGTFALGLLQGLARYNLLGKFDYLSTVSGGGYIGGWLSAWIHRHAHGLAGVTKELDPTTRTTKIDPDPPALQHLREFSNFVTPKKGLFTADTWAFVAIYLRNLLLNWLVLIPLLAAILALPRLNVSLLLSQAEIISLWSSLGARLGYTVFPPRYLFLAVGSLMLVLTITYIGLNSPAASEKLVERSPFWRDRRTQGWFLGLCLLPLVAAAFCLTTYWAWSSEAHNAMQATGIEDRSRLLNYVLFGISIPLLAWLITGFFLQRYRRENWKETGAVDLTFLAVLLAAGGIGGALIRWATKLAPDPVTPDPSGPWVTGWYACLAVPSLLILLFIVTNLFIGFTSRGISRWPELVNDEDREWWARFGAWVLIASLAWALFCILSIHGPRALFAAPKLLASVGGIAGLASIFVGFSSRTSANEESENRGLLGSFMSGLVLPLAALAFLLFFLSALSLVVTAVLRVAAGPLAGTAEAFGISTLRDIRAAEIPLDASAHLAIVHHSTIWFVGAFVIAATLVGLFMAWRINLNRFSLHAGYRNRLIRAFLGASRASGERQANPFTGFDPADNVLMHELRPAVFHEGDFENIESLAAKIEGAKDPLSEFLKANLGNDTRAFLEGYSGNAPLPRRLLADLLADLNLILESEEFVLTTEESGKSPITKVAATESPQGDRLILLKRKILEQYYPNEIRPKYPPSHRLLHVVNTTLNLVGGKNLAWQQRKAEPFAFSPLHAGCFRVGYRRSRDYGGEKGVSLGTAQAISGAAASSNMGYYTTSPVLSLVLTLFNVRLGWWLGNPGPAGHDTFYRGSPRLSISPVVQEALGLTDDTSAYVYLTDGGHFENLALYEMVLRRCRLIVLSDGSGDGKFEFADLGDAVRKIRIDLGIPIVFDEVPIFAKPPATGRFGYWAFGRIRYTEIDEGPEVRDGLLIYIKPSVYGVEPRDVVQYKIANAEFPHQSTGDQFFDEAQFESYRTLGWHVMTRLCENAFGPQQREDFDLGFTSFVHAALANYNRSRRTDNLLDTTPPFEPAWLSDFLTEPWPGEPEEAEEPGQIPAPRI
jgi:hypothetical protein